MRLECLAGHGLKFVIHSRLQLFLFPWRQRRWLLFRFGRRSIRWCSETRMPNVGLLKEHKKNQPEFSLHLSSGSCFFRIDDLAEFKNSKHNLLESSRKGAASKHIEAHFCSAANEVVTALVEDAFSGSQVPDAKSRRTKYFNCSINNYDPPEGWSWCWMKPVVSGPPGVSPSSTELRAPWTLQQLISGGYIIYFYYERIWYVP